LASEERATVVAAASEALRAGQVVLLPTETVYGLAVRADDPAAVERLREVKGRDQKPFALFVADLAAAEASAVVPAAARRLAERFWPGPLTLVLDPTSPEAAALAGAPDGSLGYRVPGQEFTREVIEAAGVPVFATSANLSGEPPQTDCAGALAALGQNASGVGLAVDGGPASLGSPSTVLRFPAQGPAQILREGFLSRAAVERAMTRLVVFVCTGNTCRSPMAEVLFRRYLGERLGLDQEGLAAAGWRIASAGVAAGQGGAAADNARQVASERGADLSAHLSQPVTADMVEAAELLVPLTENHAYGILDRFPDADDKILLLDPSGVPDPFGGPLEIYRKTADHIASRFEALASYLLDEAQAAGPGLPELFGRPVPPEHDLEPYPHGRRYLIKGEVRSWSGPTAEIESVFCEAQPDGSLKRRVIGETALLDAATAAEALEAAVEAWDMGRGAWPQLPLAKRIEAIRAFCEAIRPQREEVAKLLMWEVGKPWGASLKEFDRTIQYVDQTVEALVNLDRESGRVRDEGGVLGIVRRAPHGVVLCMGPFNYPLNETYTTLLPALAMGNTCVVKLPKLGILCNLPLLQALADHFPPGVVNVISGEGREIVTPIIASGKVDTLAFIGSSKVAGIIEKQHPAPYRLQTVLGMDAKNPALILPDADLDLTVQNCLQGSLSFNGQRCTALKLIFCHRSRLEEFSQALVAEVEALSCGMPWDEGVSITPLPEPDKPAYLQTFLEDAVAHGAEVLNPRGGLSQGTFFFPAVVSPVTPACRLYHEEQFGPIVPIVPYDDLEEVQRAIAESPFGQQISVFGNDPAVIGPLIDSLANQVCRINLNRQCQRGPDTFPFAGRKNSAEGVLSVTDALDAFSIPTMLAVGEGAGKAQLEGLFGAGTSTFARRD